VQGLAALRWFFIVRFARPALTRRSCHTLARRECFETNRSVAALLARLCKVCSLCRFGQAAGCSALSSRWRYPRFGEAAVTACARRSLRQPASAAPFLCYVQRRKHFGSHQHPRSSKEPHNNARFGYALAVEQSGGGQLAAPSIQPAR